MGWAPAFAGELGEAFVEKIQRRPAQRLSQSTERDRESDPRIESGASPRLRHMSAKITASRRRAFLEALAASGNQTLSAERAKVSRSWVCLHRANDPAFDVACREAIRQAHDRLRDGTLRDAAGAAPQDERVSNIPPTGWKYLDGAELVVRGSNGRRVQVGRARLKQWTARVEARFLAALAATCNVKAACAEVGMSVGSAYAHRRRWPGFAGRWDAAIAVGYVRLEAALIESSCAFLSGEPLPPEAPLRVTSVTEAIQALNLHKFAVKGLGRRPGR